MIVPYRDIVNAVNTAWLKGLEEGREKVREEGERKKQIEIARQMMSDGMSQEMIFKYTGLSEENLKEL